MPNGDLISIIRFLRSINLTKIRWNKANIEAMIIKYGRYSDPVIKDKTPISLMSPVPSPSIPLNFKNINFIE